MGLSTSASMRCRGAVMPSIRLLDSVDSMTAACRSDSRRSGCWCTNSSCRPRASPSALSAATCSVVKLRLARKAGSKECTAGHGEGRTRRG